MHSNTKPIRCILLLAAMMTAVALDSAADIGCITGNIQGVWLWSNVNVQAQTVSPDHSVEVEPTSADCDELWQLLNHPACSPTQWQCELHWGDCPVPRWGSCVTATFIVQRVFDFSYLCDEFNDVFGGRYPFCSETTP